MNNDNSDSDSSGSLNPLFYPKINLFGADLSGKNLINVEFPSANLCYSNLSGANLKNANLSNANLTFTNLRYAWLCGANFKEVHLNQTDFRGAIYDSQSQFDFDPKMAGMIEVSQLFPCLISIQKRELVLA